MHILLAILGFLIVVCAAIYFSSDAIGWWVFPTEPFDDPGY
jgi:hypothetical protein